MRQTAKNYLRALATLVGMIIGVGFFGVPYAVSRAGLVTGIFYFVLISLVTVFIHLSYGEVVLRTVGRHRFVGYVEKYLGKTLRRLATVTSTLGFWSAIVAYIIIGGRFAYFIFAPLFGGSEFLYQILVFAVISTFIFFGIKIVSRTEIVLSGLLVLFISILLTFSLSRADFGSALLFDAKNFFLPYGVLLFALSGTPAIPEMRDILGKDTRKLKSVIIWGTILTAILTALFAFGTIGVASSVSEDAIFSLAQALGSWVLIVGSLAGFLAVATSFLVLGLNLKEQFLYDLRRSRFVSFFLAVGAPFLAFLFLTRNFIAIIGFAGAVFTALDSALLVIVWQKARKASERQPEYTVKASNWIGWLIIALFAFGAVYEILQFFR